MRQPQIKYTENADNACDGYAHHETQQTRNSNQSKTDLCGIKVLDTLFFFLPGACNAYRHGAGHYSEGHNGDSDYLFSCF